MSKTNHERPANSGSNVARGMILGGTAKGGGFMRDRRNRRPKDAKRSWKREYQEET